MYIRRVTLTSAGEYLLKEAGVLIESVEHSVTRLQEEFGQPPTKIQVGVSRSIGLAHLPRIFLQFRRKYPEITIEIVHRNGKALLEQIEDRRMDVGVLSHYGRLPSALMIRHQFEDEFVMIMPANRGLDTSRPITPARLRRLAVEESWLVLSSQSQTGSQLQSWLDHQQVNIEPTMELESFDLIVNFVALGLGVSIIPKRVLAFYLRWKSLDSVPLKNSFGRQIAVVTRKTRAPSEHIKRFIENIQF